MQRVKSKEPARTPFAKALCVNSFEIHENRGKPELHFSSTPTSV
jgi:hypothetical protein